MANSANASACQKSLFAKLVGGGVNYPTIRNGHPAAPGGLQCSLAHWAYFALLRPQGARFVRPPPLPSSIRNGRSASCALRFAPCARHFSPSGLRCSQSSLAVLPASLGSLRPVSATGGGLRAPPYQFPLKSYGFPGAETARKRFLLWKMGFSDAAYCESMHPSIQHGRPTALASSLAALPASLGLLRAVSPTGRALRAPPPYTPPGTIEVRKGFALLSRSPLSFLTVCGNGKFCQRLFKMYA